VGTGNVLALTATKKDKSYCRLPSPLLKKIKVTAKKVLFCYK